MHWWSYIFIPILQQISTPIAGGVFTPILCTLIFHRIAVTDVISVNDYIIPILETYKKVDVPKRNNDDIVNHKQLVKVDVLQFLHHFCSVIFQIKKLLGLLLYCYDIVTLQFSWYLTYFRINKIQTFCFCTTGFEDRYYSFHKHRMRYWCQN